MAQYEAETVTNSMENCRRLQGLKADFVSQWPVELPCGLIFVFQAIGT
jgi:hypothetical protein